MPEAAGDAARAAPPTGESRVHAHLVEAESDVVGLVAYALYGQETRDWLAEWARHHRDEPTREQFDAFFAANLTNGQRDRYRSAARQLLEAHALAGDPAAGEE